MLLVVCNQARVSRPRASQGWRVRTNLGREVLLGDGVGDAVGPLELEHGRDVGRVLHPGGGGLAPPTLALAAGLPPLGLLGRLLFLGARAATAAGRRLAGWAGTGQLDRHGVELVLEDLVYAAQDRVNEAVVFGHVDLRDVAARRRGHRSCNRALVSETFSKFFLGCFFWGRGAGQML